MVLKLRYGHDTVTADLRGLHCHELRPNVPHHTLPADDLVRAALEEPLEGPSLRELASGRRCVTVLVPDATRKAWLPDVLPQVLSRLRAGGVAFPNITVLVACGTHPPASGPELAELVGP